MLAILLRNGISCQKVPGSEETYVLHVDEKKIAESVDLLKSLGYPKAEFATMGKVFKKEGLISSPLEERIRFIYALSQELSGTIAEIDGVLSSRVHIVLPENNPLSDNLTPSSASVFIKYREDSNVTASVPQIKKLVVNSIEGLTYDKVTVALFPAQVVIAEEGPAMKQVLGIPVAADAVTTLWTVLGVLIVLFLAAAGAAGYLFHRQKKGETAPELTEAGANA
ncbi:type III secretion inner membrane ring lipoprotein SctJ [Sulfidibacter corallicola]